MIAGRTCVLSALVLALSGCASIHETVRPGTPTFSDPADPEALLAKNLPQTVLLRGSSSLYPRGERKEVTALTRAYDAKFCNYCRRRGHQQDADSDEAARL
jgi:hypothetical protein